MAEMAERQKIRGGLSQPMKSKAVFFSKKMSVFLGLVTAVGVLAAAVWYLWPQARLGREVKRRVIDALLATGARTEGKTLMGGPLIIPMAVDEAVVEMVQTLTKYYIQGMAMETTGGASGEDAAAQPGDTNPLSSFRVNPQMQNPGTFVDPNAPRSGYQHVPPVPSSQAMEILKQKTVQQQQQSGQAGPGTCGGAGAARVATSDLNSVANVYSSVSEQQNTQQSGGRAQPPFPEEPIDVKAMYNSLPAVQESDLHYTPPVPGRS